ncbi:hypothetical protein [Desulfosporosinus sp. SB140]|uniref:hypothetical protein n=1 Tax=Desulfosporosinus paludis TaxID=3115649 RepID=UPI00388EDB0F
MKSLESELEHYSKIHSSIVLATDEVERFLSKEEKKARHCLMYIQKLEEYIKLLKDGVAHYKNRGFFARIANKEGIYDEEIQTFKERHNDELAKIEQCSKCKCLKCVKTCNMGGCHNCPPEAHIALCDNETKTVYLMEDRYITLRDDESGTDEEFHVLAHIYDKQCELNYIAMETNGEKRLNYLEHGPQGDSFKVITDTDDFNFALEAYEEATAEE